MEEKEQGSNEGYAKAAKMLGVASTLGLEMALFVVGASFAGEYLEENFGLGTWVTLVCVGIAGLIFVLHIRYLLRSARE